MSAQKTDIDYDKATPAELFELFHQTLLKLLASDDARIDCFSLSSGATAFQLVLTEHGHEILDPIARPLRQTPERIASLLLEDGILQFSDDIH